MAIQYIDGNADAIGTSVGTFNISGTNDQLQITIDGGSPQTVTLTHGSARTVSQVVADINAVLVGATAYNSRGFIRIRSTSANGASSSVAIGAPSNNANSTLGFSAATYPGYGRTNTTFTNNNTKQDIINQMETILHGVGWTTISGSGTTNLLMQSRFTPPGQDLVVRVRFKDNGGNCVQVTVENYSGSLAGTNSTTSGGSLLPGSGKVFKVRANGYMFIVCTAPITNAREFVAAGTVLLPSFLQGNITDAGWMQCNAGNDTDSTARNSFRTRLDNCQSSGNSNQFVNTSFWQTTNGGTTFIPGCQALQCPTSASFYRVGGYAFWDGSSLEADALILWGPTASGDVGKIMGYLCDCFVVSDSFVGDNAYTTSDGHTAVAITDSNAGTDGGTARGTLFFVTA